MQECGYTQEQASKKLGKSRPAITNSLRLLNLPKAICDMVIAGDLSAGHARVLAGMESETRQLEMARLCIAQGWSVRKLEEEAAREKKEPVRRERALSPELEGLQSSIREALGVKTAVMGTEKKGKITLSYSSAEELEHLYEVIGRLLG
jgi:ParB family chromosome partitioning protein